MYKAKLSSYYERWRKEEVNNNYKEHLICFDAKIQYLTSDYPLTAYSLKTFLIKKQINEIVSVENASLFDPKGSYAQENAVNTSYEKIEKNIPDEFDDYSGYLWINLDKLNKFIENNKGNIKQNIYTVAITSIENLSSEDQEEDEKYRKIYSENHMAMSDFPPHWSTNPAKISKNWKLLGYDVVEGEFGGMLSGLTNCGYNNDEKETINKHNWENEINSYHLFNSLEVANEFRKHTNSRVTEHAPFYVFGIYLIEHIKMRAKK